MLQAKARTVTDSAPPAPILETERLVLRAALPTDAAVLARLANDRRVAENTRRVPYPYRLSDAEAFLRQCDGSQERVFAVTQSGEAIGLCGLDCCGREPELGYWLGASHWGQGFATEAARAMLDYAFEAMDHATVVASARVSNPASRHVLEKCGFRWTGVGLLPIRAIGASVPVDQFRLNRADWAGASRWRRTRIRS